MHSRLVSAVPSDFMRLSLFAPWSFRSAARGLLVVPCVHECYCLIQILHLCGPLLLDPSSSGTAAWAPQPSSSPVLVMSELPWRLSYLLAALAWVGSASEPLSSTCKCSITIAIVYTLRLIDQLAELLRLLQCSNNSSWSGAIKMFNYNTGLQLNFLFKVRVVSYVFRYADFGKNTPKFLARKVFRQIENFCMERVKPSCFIDK